MAVCWPIVPAVILRYSERSGNAGVIANPDENRDDQSFKIATSLSLLAMTILIWRSL
jgi:hypothetical protein